MKTRKKKWIFRILLFIAVLAGLAVVAEFLIRRYMPVSFRSPPSTASENVWGDLLHVPSSIPGLAYELAPDKEKTAHGALIRTNSAGLRDREILPREEVAYRIAVLGDSFTFGFGVEGEDTFTEVLERMLNESFSEEGPIEVLNFGVGGYSTRDEALLFEHKVAGFEPDLLIIAYSLNDPEIEPVQPLQSYYTEPAWWQRWDLLRLFARMKHDWDVDRLGNGNYTNYLHAHPEKWQSVIDAFENIHNQTARQGIDVCVVIFPQFVGNRWVSYPYHAIHQQVARAASRQGFSVLDLRSAYRGYSPAALRLSDTDIHPDQLGHRLAAEAIHNMLLNKKIISGE